MTSHIASTKTDAQRPRVGKQMSQSWWGPATGIGAVVLIVASFSAVPLPPPAGATAETIRAYFVDHATGVRIYALLQALAAVPFIWSWVLR